MGNNILIADDSRNARERWKEVLRMAGLDIGKIYEAENGEAALRVVKNHWIDFILLDFEMPHKNGLAVLRDLKAMPEYGSPRVAVISGVIDQKLKTQLEEAGALVVLEKPFEIYDVVKLVSAELT